jgi:dephospho-CoA kinase
MVIIGITGTDGAGKGTVVDYLVTQHGFVHYSSRDIIAEFVVAKGLPMTRNQLRLTANELRTEYGDDYVVRQAFEQATRDGAEKIIVESIRATAEAAYLKTSGGILLAVDADSTVRFLRVQARRSLTDQVDVATFIAQEELEKNDPDPHGMQKAKVMEQADYTLMNDSSREVLHQHVEMFLKQIS